MDTTYSLDQFLADTRTTIQTKGIPAGLAEIRDHLEKLLHNPELLKKHLGDPVPYVERATIGHDPETDVHVLVHGAAEGQPSPRCTTTGRAGWSTATTRTRPACAAGAASTTAAGRATPSSRSSASS